MNLGFTKDIFQWFLDDCWRIKTRYAVYNIFKEIPWFLILHYGCWYACVKLFSGNPADKLKTYQIYRIQGVLLIPSFLFYFVLWHKHGCVFVCVCLWVLMHTKAFSLFSINNNNTYYYFYEALIQSKSKRFYNIKKPYTWHQWHSSNFVYIIKSTSSKILKSTMYDTLRFKWIKKKYNYKLTITSKS